LPWIASGGQLALVLHIAVDINVSTSTRERVMSQKANENPNPRARVTSKQKLPDPKITGLSPDDPLGSGSDSTGKPGGPMK
jgi:hypothetical protein